jgi:hypothetical protein
MAYKGKYRPQNPKKYKGDPTNIVYRSLWEQKFMRYCDLNESIDQWQSEEFFVPYRSPLDNKIHRYFPDFFIKYTDKNGNKRTMVVEIKPKKEVEMPEQNPTRRTKSWAYRVQTWVVNQAKWKAAREYCADRNYEFKIMTEDELGV